MRESAEGLAGHRRVLTLAWGLNALLQKVGWVRVRGILWRPRGRITMRDVGDQIGAIQRATEQERARRTYLKAEDVEALVERHRVSVTEPHLKVLAELLAPGDAMAQEATKRYLVKVADELAGPGASAVLKMIAMGIVLFDAESHLASSRVLRSARDHWIPHAALVRWRESAELRLNAKMKTLAFVRGTEQNELSRSLARLKLAAG
jgi:hypothetical protein